MATPQPCSFSRVRRAACFASRRASGTSACRARAGRLLLLVALASGGCASSGTSFIHPDVDFSGIQRCAIVPFQNLTDEGFADERLQSIFLSEVLQTGALAIVDPEETASVMLEKGIATGGILTPEQIVKVGEALSVQAIFLGSIEEYGVQTRTRRQAHAVTAVFSMAETETGKTIWRSQVHTDGASFWQQLFGGESASQYDVSRKAVRKALGSLF